MQPLAPITTLFLDIGGVLLTNGWGHESRHLAAKTFDLDYEEMEKRHRSNFDIYEIGKLTLKEYIQRIVFYKERSFTLDQFQEFMFTQSLAFPEMIALIKKLKSQYQLKVMALSNEGRELNAYRIQKFQLNSFIDCFVSSCYVHLSKPDADIYHLALDLAQTPIQQVLYIDDRSLLIEVAKGLGIPSLHHKDLESTKAKLSSLGLA